MSRWTPPEPKDTIGYELGPAMDHRRHDVCACPSCEKYAPSLDNFEQMAEDDYVRVGLALIQKYANEPSWFPEVVAAHDG